jgi:hypothetical protein
MQQLEFNIQIICLRQSFLGALFHINDRTSIGRKQVRAALPG